MPDVARSWDVSADGRSYRFHLRKTTWSDGRPLTAHDFEYSWKRVLDPATASKYGSFLYPIEHGEAFNRGAVVLDGVSPGTNAQAIEQALAKVAKVERVALVPQQQRAVVFLAGVDEQPELRKKAVAALNGRELAGARVRATIADHSMVGVRALDDATLDVRLENPLPYFLDLISFYTAMPVPRHVIEELEKRGLNPDLWTRVEHIVSNGPFVLEQWKFRQYLVVRRNRRYWDDLHTKLERVRLAMVESANTALNLYEAGELDYTGSGALPAEFMNHLQRFGDYQRKPFLGTYFLWFNTRATPLTDVRVRRALSLAVDRESLVEHVTRGGQIATADLVPDGVGGYQGLRRPLFDPRRARALLAEAGYGAARPLPPITLSYNTSEGHKQIAEAVQAMWRKHLGIRAEIENQEWKVYLSTLKQMNFQVARMGWIGDYPDPYTFLELVTRGNGNNHSNWTHPEYERLLREANLTRDRSARYALMRRAEALLMDEAPVLPLYVYTWSELGKPYLMGHWLNYQHRELFKYWWIDRRWTGATICSACRTPRRR
jgi:oligopeptide transport system substrate-binding protein